MQIRASLISDSIQRAISNTEPDPSKRKSAVHRRILRLVLAFFSLYKLALARYRSRDFEALRRQVWRINEQDYVDSFRPRSTRDAILDPESNSAARPPADNARDGDAEAQLKPVGDLGYSGSTFFTTPNGKYLVKSLPRRFEHEFFTHDLFNPYVAHMTAHPHSLLVRITDMVYTPRATLGGILGTAPTHHIIMENLLSREQTSRPQASSSSSPEDAARWETYDLKPDDYFFPERDIADGRLAPESIKDKLVDKFPGRAKVSPSARKQLFAALEEDTLLLADNKAIDYSLFLVRFPASAALGSAVGDNHHDGDADANPDSWRVGVVDADGRWTYRAVVLDFFWARHKFRPRAMTGLVKTFNKIARKGPMSITANPTEYRKRFLNMVGHIFVEV